MAEKFSFFNAELVGDTYDRSYTAEDLANYFKSFVTNGVYSVGTNLAVAANGMGVKVGVGKAFINGYFYDNTAELPLSLEVADGAQARIDRVVVRLDLTNRFVKCFVKTGAAAAVPTAPELTRNSTIYELALADVLVAAGATSIAASAITDKRADSALCGFVGAVGEGTAVSIAESALASAATANNTAATAVSTANSANVSLNAHATSANPHSITCDKIGAWAASRMVNMPSFSNTAATADKVYYLGFDGGQDTVVAVPASLRKARASNITMGYDGNLWISYS